MRIMNDGDTMLDGEIDRGDLSEEAAFEIKLE